VLLHQRCSLAGSVEYHDVEPGVADELRQANECLDIGIKSCMDDDRALRRRLGSEDQSVQPSLAVGDADTSLGCAWIGRIEEVEELLVGYDTVGI
jgi:hypothetical protein